MEKERNSRPSKKPRKKVCMFCADRIERIDYKDIAKLRKCMTERAKITSQTCNRYLRFPSARTYCCYQESKTHRSAPLCKRLINDKLRETFLSPFYHSIGKAAM